MTRVARRRNPLLLLGLGLLVLIAVGGTAALVLAGAAGREALVDKLARAWDDPRAAMATLRGRLSGRSASAATTPLTAADKPMQIGVNLTLMGTGTNAPGFANLMIGTHWRVMGKGWEEPPLGVLAPDGELTGRNPGGLQLIRAIYPTSTGPDGARFRCVWRGRGAVRGGGAMTVLDAGPNAITFRRTVTWPRPKPAWLVATAIDPRDPIRRVDCRRADMPRTARFDPDLIAFARNFRILRFMDWQRTNYLETVRWAERVRPGETETTRPGGIAVEDMMALSAEAGADPWFTVPWDADDDYVRRFAETVRDTLPAGRRVYVELSNEVWNRRFPVFARAAAEGRARGLAADDVDAALFRYGERAIHVMGLWRAVFAGREDRLVRVVSVQHFSPRAGDKLLGFRDVASHVDALATAPYFGSVVRKPDTTDRAVWFGRLDESIDRTVRVAAAHRAVATRFGKRYIAYEGGQHMVTPLGPELADAINRDPRMYDAYRRYLGLWRAHLGDAFVHYAGIRRNTRSGAWGLAEYPGQPLSEAPKLRAVLQAIEAR